MDSVRIAELLVPFIGTRDESAPENKTLFCNISIYIDILLRWNARMNLTAIRDPEEIVTRHFGESLFTARHLFPHPVGTAALGCPAERSSAVARGPCSPGASPPVSLADVGSGAGFPGIPIKLWAPASALTLIESNYKKSTFLREVARALRLTDINIQTTRTETVPPATFDVVTLRAVERFTTILRSAASLVKPAGRLALMISRSQLAEAQSTLSTSYHCSEPIPIPLSQSRVLLLGLRSRTIQVPQP